LDNPRGRQTCPAVGLGRKKHKRNNQRPQAEEEYNEYQRASEWNVRYEEVAGRVKSTVDVEAGKTCVDGTTSRESSADDRVAGGGGEEHGARTYRVHNNDPGGDHNTSIRIYCKEGCAC
jgi:hypothetical protein